MWIDRLATGALLVLAPPALADYAQAPFHDRAFAVADLALTVLDSDTPVAIPQDTALTAAVAALLLLSERGLAEAYGEAVGDDAPHAYAEAFALWQRITPWVAAVAIDAGTADLVARLDALLPGPDRPAQMDADPEAAEVMAQALVGHLESVADVDLYLARDLSRALDTVSDLAAQGCSLDDADRDRRFEIAALYFEDALEAPLSVMAADEAEVIEDGFDALQADDLSACDALGTAFADAKRRMFP